MVVAFPLLFAILLIFTHPMTSTDVYDYLFRGRMLARYQANPFVAFPWQFRTDPLIKYVAWKLVVTAYGPLWEGMSWATMRLAGEAPGAPGLADGGRLLALILAYKALAALSFLLCGAAIWLALRRATPRQRWLGVYLWLWNPLALWETIGAAHNDAWMALCIVLAVAFLSAPGRDKATRWQGDKASESDKDFTLPPRHWVTWSVGALLALTAGGLIKFVAFFFGPVALAAALRLRSGWRARVGLFALAGAACAALAGLAYAPFWAGWATFENVRDRRDLYTSSWLGVLRVLLKRDMPDERAASIVAAAGLALLFAGMLWASWRAWREPERLRAHMLWLSLWFLFVCNPWFQPWYAVWPLALAATQPWRARAVAGVIALCLASMVSYIAGGLILPALGMPDKSLGREAWMAALITIPPLLVFGWGWLASAPRALRRRLTSVAARTERTVESSSQESGVRSQESGVGRLTR